MSNNVISAAKSPRVAIVLLGGLALFQVVRTLAFSIIQDVLAGKTAEAWLFPASMDVFVGVTAIFVAIGIWRAKGLAIWTAAIVFFSLSISDHADAIIVVLNTKGPLPAMMSGPTANTATMLVVTSIVEAFAIWGLTTKRLRAHYLTAK